MLKIEEIYIVSSSKINSVHGTKETIIELEPKKATEVDIVTPQIAENRTQLNSIGYRSETGGNLKGIIVRAKIDGEIVKVYSSDGSWAKLAWGSPFTLMPPK